jgi:hypothetical protein
MAARTTGRHRSGNLTPHEKDGAAPMPETDIHDAAYAALSSEAARLYRLPKSGRVLIKTGRSGLGRRVGHNPTPQVTRRGARPSCRRAGASSPSPRCWASLRSPTPSRSSSTWRSRQRPPDRPEVPGVSGPNPQRQRAVRRHCARSVTSPRPSAPWTSPMSSSFCSPAPGG